MRIAVPAGTALVAVALAGCGGDDEPEATTQAETTTEDGATGATGASPEQAAAALAGLKLDDREGAEPPAVEQKGLEGAADAAGCELRLDLPDEGNEHMVPGEPPPRYDTDPPTSGPHDPVPTPDGAFLDTPKETGVVHALEHGRIVIQYSPDLDDKDQLLLKGVFDDDPAGMLLFPNPEMPYEVAATAWTQLLACKDFDPRVTDALLAFRDDYRGRGPEQIPF
jgi:Protein of unknown function (DUF3105)